MLTRAPLHLTRAPSILPIHLQLLNTRFTRSFYKHMISAAVSAGDMADNDPEYARGLQWLLDNDITQADLGLTFW